MDYYNHSYHRSIKSTSATVNRKNAHEVWEVLYPSEIHPLPQFKFQVGDLVRIAQHRATFRKSYESGWTEELFKITERVPRKTSMYKLRI